MIIPLGKWLKRAKAVAFFLLLAGVLHGGFDWLGERLMPYRKFAEPDGRAVKVNAVREAAEGEAGFRERLRFYYWYGE